jgi:hypothetical protein
MLALTAQNDPAGRGLLAPQKGPCLSLQKSTLEYVYFLFSLLVIVERDY